MTAEGADRDIPAVSECGIAEWQINSGEVEIEKKKKESGENTRHYDVVMTVLETAFYHFAPHVRLISLSQLTFPPILQYWQLLIR